MRCVRIDAVCNADQPNFGVFEEPLNLKEIGCGSRETREVFDDNHIDLTWRVGREANETIE